jgi:HEAT repeat protein
MMEKNKFEGLKSLFCVLVACLLVFTGCSHSSKNVTGNTQLNSEQRKSEQIKSAQLSDVQLDNHVSKDIPAKLRPHIVKLHSPSSAERAYGAIIIGKAGREAVSAVPHLLDIIKENDAEIMKPVIDALGQIGDRRAVDPLIEILSDRTSPYRADAAKALGGIGDNHSILPLVAILNDRTVIDSDVTTNSIWALGEIKDPRTIEPLITALINNSSYAAEALNKIDPNWQKSEMALNGLSNYIDALKVSASDEVKTLKIIDAISEIGSPAVAPLFILLMDKDVHIRKSAATALSGLNWQPTSKMESIIYFIADQKWNELVGIGKFSIPHLISTLKDNDQSVRKSAAWALSKLDWKPVTVENELKYLIASQRWGALAIIGGPSSGSLAELLRDEDENIRKEASATLIKIGPASIEPVISILKDKNVLARKIALSTLDAIDPDWQNSEMARRALPKFIKSLNSYDSNVRASSAWALSILKDERAVKPLISALNDYDAGVRIYVSKALGEIGDKIAIKPLISKLNDKDSAVRGYAALALGEIKDPAAIEPLFDVLTDKDSWPRQSAVKALKRIDPKWAQSNASKKAVPGLIAGLDDENINVQKGAVKVLGDIKNASAVEPLIEKLSDNDKVLRNSAARALGKIGDSRAVEPLIYALKNNDVNEYDPSATILALGKIMDVRAVKPLIEALNDDSARAYAVRALQKITGEEFGDDLIKWQKWWDERCKHGSKYCMYIKVDE